MVRLTYFVSNTFWDGWMRLPEASVTKNGLYVELRSGYAG